MGQKVLLVNPSKRPSQRKKPRTAAQKRATKKLVALNKKRAAAKGRSKNPSKRTTKKRTSTMAAKKRRTAAQRAATKKLVALNKRRAKGGVKRKRNPIHRKTSRVTRRRNPIRRAGVVNNIVMPAVTAASGALALDIAWAHLPLPANIKSGNLKYAAKALGAVGLSMAAGMVVNKRTADAMGIGALTVVAHQMARDLLSRTVPALKMDGMGYYSAGMPMGSPEDNMGLYVNGQNANMGLYVNGTENGYSYN